MNTMEDAILSSSSRASYSTATLVLNRSPVHFFSSFFLSFSLSLCCFFFSLSTNTFVATRQSTCLTKITRELNNRQDWCTCMCSRVWRKKKKRKEAKKREREERWNLTIIEVERGKREYSSFNTKDLPSAFFPVTSKHGRNGKVALRSSFFFLLLIVLAKRILYIQTDGITDVVML